MKNALFVTTIGGFVPKFEMNDVRILQEYGFLVHYASNFDNPVYEVDREALACEGIQTHQICIQKSPFNFSLNGKATRELIRIIDQEEIDLIHCHNPMGGVAARLAAGKSRRKPYVIYTAHGLHFYNGAPVKNWLLYYTAERFLARFTDQLVTINREDCLRARAFPLKKSGQVSQIHGVGVDFERFCPRPEKREAMRESLGIPRKAFHIVTVAEVNENKNQSVIIKAIAKLDDPEIYYTLCGKGVSEAALRKLIHELHLEKQVRLLGYRSDIENILQSADLFAFPSIREGLGIAAVEALGCGIPVIAADNRGTKEYMQDGVNGIVCQASDVWGFAEAIRRLKTDAQYRKRLCGNCRESVREKFSLADTEKRMRCVYKKAMEALGE